MPKIPVDYSKSIIYKICCKDINIIDIYIGSTTDFIRRKSSHKRNCNNDNLNGYNIYVYQFIRENGGWNNWDMVEIEKYIAIDNNDLHKRERFYIEELKATLNKVIPSRTKNEYEIMRKDKPERKEQKKQIGIIYREKNNEIIKEKKKIYRQTNNEKINCPCGSCIVKYTLTDHIKTKKHQKYLNEV